MYPPAVHEEQVYAGHSACRLRAAGEKPLWRGVTDPTHRQQARFTFTDGHSRYTRVINLVELHDGQGWIEVKTITPGGRQKPRITEKRRFRVSFEDMTKFNELAEASGTWTFENGTWHGDEDPETIYLHCQTLDMERVNSSGYRFSSVNIGCIRPRKLEPLVEHVTRLARLKANGRVY